MSAVFSWVALAASRRYAKYDSEYNVFRGLIHIPLGLSLGSSPTDYAWPQRRGLVFGSGLRFCPCTTHYCELFQHRPPGQGGYRNCMLFPGVEPRTTAGSGVETSRFRPKSSQARPPFSMFDCIT